MAAATPDEAGRDVDLAPGTDNEPVLLSWLAAKRDEHPVWVDRYGSWHVFRHADVLSITADPTAFSSNTARLFPASAPVSRGMLTQLDPPEHQALRHLVSAAFIPRTVAALEGRIRAITHELLEPVGEQFDLVDALAFPLPVIVIAELLGLPAADRELFRSWADGLFAMQVDDPRDPQLGPRIAAAMADITAYLTQHCRDRRAHPRDDLMTALVTAEIDGRRLDDQECANFSMLLLLAGHVTTTLLLGNAVRTFDEHAGVWDRLRAAPDLIPATIEEVLRYRPPFTQLGRATMHPVTLSGVSVPADVVVIPWLLSANRDPRAHLDPDSFEIGRGVHGGAQLSFGHGIHFCLGAPLARLEARIALHVLGTRFQTLSLDHERIAGDELRYYPRGMLGTRNLPVLAANA